MPRLIRPVSDVPRPLQRQIFFWAAVLALGILLLYLFSPILLPFVLGMAVAFALDPIADWLERRGLSRLWATMTILAVFVVILLLLLIAVVPVLIQQLGSLIASLPDLAAQLRDLLTPLLESRLFRWLGVDSSSLGQTLSGFSSTSASWLAGIFASVLTGGAALFGVVSLLLLTPVVAFYLLLDWDRMMAHVDEWLPREHAPTIRRLASEMTRAIAGFVRGQGLVCIILGIIYAASLGAIGLNYGLLIGLLAGLLSFIPFVGSLVGFVVSMAVAAIQFWPQWPWIAATAAIFVLGQFIEGNILQPRLVGNSVGLHPVWLMFALLAFGLLFGFVGTLIAVPASAAIGVLVRYGLERYLASPYYRGVRDPDEIVEKDRV